MRYLMPVLGTLASALLWLFWLIGWILLRGEMPGHIGLTPVMPLLLAAVAGAGALLHLWQLLTEAFARRFAAAGRLGLRLAGTVAAAAALGAAMSDTPMAQFWPAAVIAAAMNFLCAAMPPERPKDNA